MKDWTDCVIVFGGMTVYMLGFLTATTLKKDEIRDLRALLYRAILTRATSVQHAADLVRFGGERR